jgi:hypothetical protein
MNYVIYAKIRQYNEKTLKMIHLFVNVVLIEVVEYLSNRQNNSILNNFIVEI